MYAGLLFLLVLLFVLLCKVCVVWMLLVVCVIALWMMVELVVFVRVLGMVAVEGEGCGLPWPVTWLVELAYTLLRILCCCQFSQMLIQFCCMLFGNPIKFKAQSEFLSQAYFLSWKVVRPTPNLQAGGTLLVGCLRLFMNVLAAAPHSWRHTPCRLSAAVYSMYWQLPSRAGGTPLVCCLQLHSQCIGSYPS
jgi:hypothetical protein